jgi:hypothetical protein
MKFIGLTPCLLNFILTAIKPTIRISHCLSHNTHHISDIAVFNLKTRAVLKTLMLSIITIGKQSSYETNELHRYTRQIPPDLLKNNPLHNNTLQVQDLFAILSPFEADNHRNTDTDKKTILAKKNQKHR